MRNRTLLSLIEMLIMVMVFTVTAAICLRAFVYADRTSRVSEEAAEAAVRAQSAAELMQHFAGDTARAAAVYGGTCSADGVWTAAFDEDWKLLEGDGAGTAGGSTAAAYYMETKAENGPAAGGSSAFLGEGSVIVRNAAGDELFGIPVCWQQDGTDTAGADAAGAGAAGAGAAAPETDEEGGQ